ncbi:MAG: putative bifunctional diguanylate cyclase/phosphodiesterase [Acidimicrobiales bacterium]
MQAKRQAGQREQRAGFGLPFGAPGESHDTLTGLPTRTLLYDRLEVALARAMRSGRLVAVLRVDLDRFGPMAQRHGPAAADEVLVEIAERLRTVLRPSDSVARAGRDEFVLICDDLSADEEALSIAARVSAAIRAPIPAGAPEAITVSASIGLAFADGFGVSPDGLVNQAGVALASAKRRGRDRCEVFRSSVSRHAHLRLEGERNLADALDKGQLRVWYQPTVALASGGIVGFEALLRWQHPQQGLVSPSSIVSIAEDSGLIVPIGRWVLEHACRQLAAWHAGLALAAPLRVNVNLSACQLDRPELVAEVAQAIAAAEISPEQLTLELTESALLADLEASADTLNALKELGVTLAVDDFGTGYSSLNYVRRFPIDSIKIDGSFTAGLGGGPPGSAIVEAVVNLAHALDMECTAEGVETSEHLCELRRLGCDVAQGYYLRPPMPPDQVPALLASAPRW